jgi:hypothetical protein
VLGEAKISTPQNLDGYPQRMYDGKISCLHIQLVGKKSEIYIVAVGPKKGSHNKPAADNAGIERRLTIKHHWPGVPEPER